ncbi:MULTISPECIES: chemotaxis protein CheA [Exiguobacterium]|uniref:Chemotaxis protein CheA n=1 Tax=Exiguobacterium antarcticum TaxID=132920 RepID=A0ABT6QYV4_9BACL|nr:MULTISPECIES: chemotaxis protein CheA [Exiguobacterium]AFS70816.1 Chemotaxis protein CheA [Exiguobacterium antarcticum B7]MCT4779679.1 chemotaxis protein CheA [Exiguobacterium soli]MDI3233871.1 chemotaxis protein CheA [Exiguobacterium antarcticum]
MDLNEYLGLFLDESIEHLQAINSSLLIFEQRLDDEAVIDQIFRSAHTLKGMSGTMGYDAIADLTHEMESALDLVRSKTQPATPDLIDVLFVAAEQLETMVEDISQGGTGKLDVATTVVRLKQFIQKDGETDKVAANPVVSVIKNFECDVYSESVVRQSMASGYQAYVITVELSADVILKAARVYMVFDRLQNLGDVILSNPTSDELEQEQFETSFDVLFVTMKSEQEIQEGIKAVSEVAQVLIQPFEVPVEPVAAAATLLEPTDNPLNKKPVETVDASGEAQTPIAAKTIRVNLERIDRLMNLFEEFIIDRGRLERIAAEVGSSDLTETVERIKRGTNELQSLVLTLRMMPIEQVFNRFPRMVRSVSKDVGKNIKLHITGAETELDRTVIDEIGDPLVHLIRNAVDHGIESKTDRILAGKAVEGNLSLRAYHSGNRVFIEIEDDGAGINHERVTKIALEKGLLTEEEAALLTPEEAAMLLFAPGFSTAETVTDLSGRGVGLDVVKSKIESLGGEVFVETKRGEGTIFRISLPLTLSIISAMLVKLGQETYAIPLTAIIETTSLKQEAILQAHREKVFDFRGQLVPLISLNQVYGLPQVEADAYSVVVVRSGEKLAGLIVSELIGQQEIVMKPLGSYLEGIRAISGATILGDGQVALIIDSNALLRK